MTMLALFICVKLILISLKRIWYQCPDSSAVRAGGAVGNEKRPGTHRKWCKNATCERWDYGDSAPGLKNSLSGQNLNRFPFACYSPTVFAVPIAHIGVVPGWPCLPTKQIGNPESLSLF